MFNRTASLLRWRKKYRLDIFERLILSLFLGFLFATMFVLTALHVSRAFVRRNTDKDSDSINTEEKEDMRFSCSFFAPLSNVFFYSYCKLFCFKTKFKNRQGLFKQKLIQIQTKSTKWKGMVWDVPCFYFSLYQLCFYFVIFSPTAPGISSGF